MMKYHSGGRHGRDHLVQRFQLQVFTSQTENVHWVSDRAECWGLPRNHMSRLKAFEAEISAMLVRQATSGPVMKTGSL